MSFTFIDEDMCSSGERRESRIVFSNITTEAKKFELLNQVELVDKFCEDQHMRERSLPFAVEG